MMRYGSAPSSGKSFVRLCGFVLFVTVALLLFRRTNEREDDHDTGLDWTAPGPTHGRLVRYRCPLPKGPRCVRAARAYERPPRHGRVGMASSLRVRHNVCRVDTPHDLRPSPPTDRPTERPTDRPTERPTLQQFSDGLDDHHHSGVTALWQIVAHVILLVAVCCSISLLDLMMMMTTSTTTQPDNQMPCNMSHLFTG